jgi:hypothetical protein
MAACHHCGVDIEALDEVSGRCDTCGEVGKFCKVCGWWEVGVEGIPFSGFGDSRKGLKPKTDVVLSCQLNAGEISPIVDACDLMTEQKTRASPYKSSGYTYSSWNGPKNWNDAVANAVHWIDGFFSDPDSDDAKRIRAMLITYLSAWEYCLRNQLQRLADGNIFAPLSLHDASAVAARHYKAHNGFDLTASLDFDCGVLLHVDTVEQYLKGKMKPSVAALLIRDSQGEARNLTRKKAIEATLLHLTHLTIVAPIEGQTLPEETHFSPAENRASGIYPQAYIDSCFISIDQRKASVAVMDKLAVLLEMIQERPAFAGRQFRFNSLASDGRLNANDRLSDNQRMYLKSLPDLDDDDCPARCKTVLTAKTLDMLGKFMENLGQSEDIVSELAKVADFSDLYSKDRAADFLNAFVKFAAAGKLALQTSANNALFITTKPYVGLWALRCTKKYFGVALECSKADGDFVCMDYQRADVKEAADQRKDCPFRYMSWRVQKDRIAHKFFPMDPADYEVTAAVSQEYLVPRPEATYGKQMIIWKPDVIGCCTFKVRDSGRPTRSFMVLLHDLLFAARTYSDPAAKQAVLNLFSQLFRLDSPLADRFDEITNDGLCTFPSFPFLRLLDVEAHVYAQLTIADTFGIVYPASADTLVDVSQDVSAKVNGRTRAVFYDEATWQQMDAGSDEAAKIFNAIARVEV